MMTTKQVPEFEDTKWVIGSRKSKERQYIMAIWKKTKSSNNDLQNTTEQINRRGNQK